MTPVAIPCEGFTLEAEVEERSPTDWAIVCHPHPAFGGRMHTPLVVALSDALNEANVSTIRFNFRGLENSGGTPTGGHREHEDIRAVATWARTQGATTLSLVGYSFGALMATKAIAAGERPSALAAVGFPTTIISDHPDRITDVKKALETKTPSLFVSGDQDQFCNLADLRAWLANAPTARLVIEPNLGHFPSSIRSAQIAESIAAFVSSTAHRD